MGEGSHRYPEEKERPWPGARIYAGWLSYGASGDAYHIVQPEPEGDGAARAFAMAMQEAGVTPDQVDYINAHGTSTEFNDAMETRALKKVLGARAYEVAVSSSKSMVGHMLGAAGAVELIAAHWPAAMIWYPRP